MGRAPPAEQRLTCPRSPPCSRPWGSSRWPPGSGGQACGHSRSWRRPRCSAASPHGQPSPDLGEQGPQDRSAWDQWGLQRPMGLLFMYPRGNRGPRGQDSRGWTPASGLPGLWGQQCWRLAPGGSRSWGPSRARRSPAGGRWSTAEGRGLLPSLPKVWGALCPSLVVQQQHDGVELSAGPVVGPERHDEVVQPVARRLRRHDDQLILEAVGLGVFIAVVLAALRGRRQNPPPGRERGCCGGVLGQPPGLTGLQATSPPHRASVSWGQCRRGHVREGREVSVRAHGLSRCRYGQTSCVCAHIWSYAYTLSCVHVCTHLVMCVHTAMCACVHTFGCAHRNLVMCAHVLSCVHVCTHLVVCIYIRSCVRVCTHLVCIHIWSCMHVCTH